MGVIAGAGRPRRLPDGVPAQSTQRPSTPVQLAMIAVIGALPGLVLADVVAGARSLPVAATVAGAATLFTTLVARPSGTRRAWWLRTLRHPLATAVLLVLAGTGAAFITAAVWPGDTGRSALGAVADATLRGWAELVTAPVPAPPEPRLLVPVAIAVFAAVAGATLLTLRSSARLAPLLPLTALFLLACLAAGARQVRPALAGAALVAAAAVVIALRAPRPQPAVQRAGWRPQRAVTAGVVVATVAAAAGWFAGPVIAAGRDEQPFDARSHVEPPHLPTDAENPLHLVAHRLQHGDTPLFTVSSDEPLTTRLAVLDAFDGATWRPSGAWVAAGTSVSVDTDVGEQRTVLAEIVIDGLRGPWLPSIGLHPDVVGVPAIVQSHTGAVAIEDGASAGLAYEVRALVPVLAGDLDRVSVATDDEASAALALPAAPPELRTMANDYTRGARTPLRQAALLQQNLRTNFAYDDTLRPGHSYGHLLRAFGRTGVGTDEQFATGFAVLGRLVGLPTRVVVGFDPGTETSPGTYVVTSGDVRVWPEVKFDGVGWVAFNPTPDPGGAAPDLDDATETVGTGEGVVVDLAQRDRPDAQPATEQADRPTPVPVPPEPQAAAGSGRSQVETGVLATGATAAIAALAAAVIIGGKQLRTSRRRRATDARARLLGAWHDVLDRLAEMGAGPATRHTVAEHIAAAGTLTSTLSGMHRPVSLALYGSHGPRPEDAERAWTCRDRFVREARRRAGFVRRARRALDVRTLFRPTAEARP